ncbi:hypothetical protein JYK14_20060 [Siccirubricoccus sp. KC 17139]|uniref:Calcium-binding protein n=1 Tax=Siccirubricoccus soli TaxID=2899147 RepID=A0ABT1DA09_9PROT|nr:hypothetical protein [Siccirubricoccus soli]MCO6418442.1 hypothetical protein [Siccirubricoccus soli]MCP2684577.1 hypothetical protein [Siccirubricoccus soli]
MAFILGPAQGHGQIDGTDGNDVLIARGSHNTITDDGGRNIVISGDGGHDSLHLGMPADPLLPLPPPGTPTLSDAVLLRGEGNTLLGGEADFRILGLHGGNHITLGSGSNDLRLFGEHNSVELGRGDDSIHFFGGHASVVQHGLAYGGAGTTTIQFTGTGNSLSVINDTPAALGPARANVVITGGDGQGSFGFAGAGTFSLRTHGEQNEVSTGTGRFDIAPGDGHDIVHLGFSARGGGASGTITLNGTHNTIDGSAGSVTVTGGDGHTTLDFRNGFSSSLNLMLGGSHNSLTNNIPTGGTIDMGEGDATLSLFGNSATITFHGAGNVATLDNANHGTINDRSDGLRLNVSSTPGLFSFTETVENFGADRGAVVALDAETTGYATAQSAYAALHGDGMGNTVLDLPNAGELVFAGLSPTALHEDNFLIA